MALFFHFEDNRFNLAFYFLVTTLVMYLGPEFWLPSLNPNKNVPIIEAPAGKFKGTLATSRLGRQIFSYRGIPYAKPPVGELRFKRPVPMDEPLKQGSLYEATSHGDVCAQTRNMLSGQVNPFSSYFGNEDCLTINIYTPNVSNELKVSDISEMKLPVMAFIHGGGFSIGDAFDATYGPHHLLDRDVILVTFQYRLGIFGALNLATEDIPGNQALWDQHLALKWINRNIAAFGGDPKKVTLFGESAGAMSVLYQMMFKKNEKLFRSAIIMSGSPKSPLLMFDSDKPMKEFHSQLLPEFGCEDLSTNNHQDVLKCLQSISVRDLLKKADFFDQCNIYEGMFSAPILWKPSFDGYFSKNPFFEKDPIELLDTINFLKVPIMMGFNKDEGLLGTANVLRRPNLQDMLEKNWDKCMIHNVFGKWYKDITEKDYERLELFKEFYFKDKDLQNFQDYFYNLTKLLGDVKFGYSMDNIVRGLVDEKRKVFYYKYHHPGTFSTSDIFGREFFDTLRVILLQALGQYQTEELGTCHGDEIFYLFGSSHPIKLVTDEDHIALMVDIWTNFAIYMDPTPLDGDKKIIGNSLESLSKRWSRSKMEDGTPSYAILKNAEIFYEKDLDEEKRFEFLRKVGY